MTQASVSGWSATASHTGTTRRCAIYVGPEPEPPARRPGEPACTAAPLGQTMRGVAEGIAILALGMGLAIAGAAVRPGALGT